MHLGFEFIKKITPQVQLLGPDLPKDCEFVVDSRLIKKNDIFVALKGNHVDGHDFITEAIKKGACGLIINKNNKSALDKIDQATLKKISVIVAEDVQDFLIKLATAWRAQFNYPVIGITGSIGKTSTKEMLANILKVNGNKFIASNGNQNTALGISLNILRMNNSHEMAIFEMGVSRRSEMAHMAQIARPTIAIITAIGHSHMEGLGSLVDIANEKRSICQYFTADNFAIINGDQPILANISYTHPVVKFGCKTTNQVQGRKIQTNNLNTHFILKLYKDKYKIILDTNHEGRINNALASSACAYMLGISPVNIIKGIQETIIIPGRFEHIKLKSNNGVLINDCYNASPESMKAAILAFEKVESKGQKIAVLGDMLELGVNTAFWHRQLGRLLRKAPSLNHLILVGNNVNSTKNTIPFGLSFDHVSNWQEAVDCLKSKLNREAVILVKASRSMELNNLVKELTA